MTLIVPQNAVELVPLAPAPLPVGSAVGFTSAAVLFFIPPVCWFRSIFSSFLPNQLPVTPNQLPVTPNQSPVDNQSPTDWLFCPLCVVVILDPKTVSY
jgi:hypothetical protein